MPGRRFGSPTFLMETLLVLSFQLGIIAMPCIASDLAPSSTSAAADSASGNSAAAAGPAATSTSVAAAGSAATSTSVAAGGPAATSNNAAAVDPAAATSGSGTSTTDSASALKGNVVAEDKSIIVALNELGEICRRIKTSATDLLYESQRPDTVAIGGPTIIGNTVIPIGPAPGGVMNMGGYLPPRKKWVDLFVSQIAQLFPLLETQITSASSPDNDPTATALIADMKVQLASMKPSYDRLISDTQGPPYNRANITNDASALMTYADQIEKARKQLDRIAKKAEKKAEKLEKQHSRK